MFRNLSEKLRAKLPATIRGYSMLKFVRLDDAFSECFELEASPVEGQSPQQKEKKQEKERRKKEEKEAYAFWLHLFNFFHFLRLSFFCFIFFLLQ